MRTINVEELPEPVALVLQTMVETLKAQLRKVADKGPGRRVGFHTKPGQALTNLRRQEIYGDAL
jgi:hypothetical protein